MNSNDSYFGKKGYTIYKKNYTKQKLQNIKNDLTMTPIGCSDYGKLESFPIFTENSKKMYLPKQYGIKNFGEIKDWRITKGDKIDVKFSGKLRDSQITPVEKCLTVLKDKTKGGGILSVKCGGGKSCMAMYIMSILKRKTIICISLSVLQVQWAETIKQFLPNARIGYIQGKTVDVENKDVVIAMVQSITMKDYPKGTFDGFGLMVCDEVHKMGSKIFSRIFRKINCYYALSLSATVQRADGLHKVFEYHIGDVIHESKIDTVENSKILLRRIIYEDESSEAKEKYSKEVLNFKKKPVVPIMVNNVAAYLPRTNIILDEVLKLALTGRKILVLSTRRNHIETMHDLFQKMCQEKITSGIMLGGMKVKDRKETETKQVIFASLSLCSTGLNLPELNTLFLCISMSSLTNLKQSCGRVLRKFDPKYPPIIVDICDTFSCFGNQAKKRMRFYKKNNYTLVDENYEPLIIEKKRKKKKDICFFN